MRHYLSRCPGIETQRMRRSQTSTPPYRYAYGAPPDLNTSIPTHPYTDSAPPELHTSMPSRLYSCSAPPALHRAERVKTSLIRGPNEFDTTASEVRELFQKEEEIQTALTETGKRLTVTSMDNFITEHRVAGVVLPAHSREESVDSFSSANPDTLGNNDR